MSIKLIWLAGAMVLAGGLGALVITAKDTPAIRIAADQWSAGTIDASDAGAGAGFSQGAGSGGAPPPAPPEAGGAPAATAAEGEAPKAAGTTDEMLEQLKAWTEQDPRTIIDKKFEDLEGKETEPWNEDNPETYIPETGRNDPLTPVIDAMPEELRPPRGGDDDENEIMTYLFSQFATEAASAVADNLRVYNMVQIGFQKLVTMGLPGQSAFTVSEGDQFRMGIPVQGVGVAIDFIVASVSEDDVMVIIVASVQGTNVSITREAHFIPGTPSGAIDDEGGRGGGGRGGGGGGRPGM